MPKYDFHCLSCGTDFEEQRRMAEATAVASCPACHSTETRKRVGGVNIVSGGTASIPVPMSNSGGCGCGGGCACGH